MNLPFTREQFFRVFAEYNRAVFPMQIVIVAIALALWIGILARKRSAGTLTAPFLAAMWIWAGVVYHSIFFTTINALAELFGVLFMLEGILIMFEYFRGALQFQTGNSVQQYLGHFFIVYGLLIYPVLIYVLEGTTSTTILAGLPCPSVIMTFGFFLLAAGNMRKYLLILPTIWAVLGISAAVSLGVYPDFMLPVAGLIADILLLRKRQVHRVAVT